MNAWELPSVYSMPFMEGSPIYPELKKGSLTVIIPGWMEDINDPAMGQCFAEMDGVWRNYSYDSGTEDSCLIINGELKFPFNDGGHLFMGMRMGRQGAPRLHGPVGNCHVLGMHELNLGSGNDFFYFQVMQVDKRHRLLPDFFIEFYSIILMKVGSFYSGRNRLIAGGDPQGDRTHPQEEQNIYSRQLILRKISYPEFDRADTVKSGQCFPSEILFLRFSASIQHFE
jgi:hypothetical protein